MHGTTGHSDSGAPYSARGRSAASEPLDPRRTPTGSDHRRRRPSRSTLSVGAALLLATGAIVAAVVAGSSGASGAPAATPPAAPPVTSVAFSVSATLTKGSTTSTVLSGNGAADFANGDGTTTLTVPALASFLGGNGTVSAVWQGTNLYLDVPSLSSFLGGKSWAEVSLSGIPDITSVGSTVQSYLSDPSKLGGVVRSLGGTVTTVGPVQLNGQPATEYKASIPVSGLVSSLKHLAHHHGSNPKPASPKNGVRALKHLGITSIPVTAWVGSNGLLSQVALSLDLTHASVPKKAAHLPGTSLFGGALDVTVGLSGYGAPVPVTVPPASEVDDLGSAVGLLQNLSHLGSLAGLAARR